MCPLHLNNMLSSKNRKCCFNGIYKTGSLGERWHILRCKKGWHNLASMVLSYATPQCITGLHPTSIITVCPNNRPRTFFVHHAGEKHMSLCCQFCRPWVRMGKTRNMGSRSAHVNLTSSHDTRLYEYAGKRWKHAASRSQVVQSPLPCTHCSSGGLHHKKSTLHRYTRTRSMIV